MSAFELLSEPLRRALEGSGIVEPTEPQEVGIPAMASGESVLLIAPTGLGKTEAVVLPLIDRLLRERPAPPSLLYITPLRALNRDLLRRIDQWAGELGFRVGVRHGDTPRRERAEQLRRPPDVLITTPETLQIMLGGASLRRLLSNVRWVVVDEIHELAGDERGWQLAVGLERLGRVCGRELQRVGVSATVGNAEEVASFLAGVGRRAMVIRVPVGRSVSISVECPSVLERDRADAERLRCDERTVATLRRCSELFGGSGGTLLFTNTRDSAEVLASRFRLWKPELPIGVHHGSLHRDVRVWMEEEFKAGRLRGLICTSSLELGIDIGGVELTLQHGSPRQATRLVQRVGRSGHRRGLVSRGVVLAQDADDAAEAAVLARRARAEEIEPVRMRRSPLGVLANQLVALAVESGAVDADEAFDTMRRAHPFRELDRDTFDRVLEQLVSLGVLWSDGGDRPGSSRARRVGGGGSGLRDGGLNRGGGSDGGSALERKMGGPRRYGRRRGAIEFFYENLSMIPDEKSYRVIDITTRASIGTLDEFFVSTYGEVGARFVVRGASWRIVELRGDSILVEPSPELGAVPGWIGEEIPVPLEAAQEVGRLRAALARALMKSPQSSGDGGRERDGTPVRNSPPPEEPAPLLGRVRDVVPGGDAPPVKEPTLSGGGGWDGAPTPPAREGAGGGQSADTGIAAGGPTRESILSLYPLDDGALKEIEGLLKKQLEAGLPVPTDRLVTVEAHRGGRVVVVNACFGTRVNDTLARLLSALLAARFGSEVGVQTDPYRIVLELPAPIRPEVVIEHLRRIGQGDASRVLGIALGGSSLLKRELLHTARRFGAVERGADFREVSFERVMRVFRGTPLYEEAVEKALFERMDVPGAEEALRRIREGEVELVPCPPSPIGEAGVRMRWEALAAGRVERPILLAFKARLERASLRLLCMACKRTSRLRVGDAPDRVQCPHCSGRMVAALPIWDERSLEAVERWSRASREGARKRSPAKEEGGGALRPGAGVGLGPSRRGGARAHPVLRGVGRLALTEEDKRALARLRKCASLVLAHGRRAVLALAARGVGVDTAARILGFQHETEEELLRAILAAEVQYAKNRRFW